MGETFLVATGEGSLGVFILNLFSRDKRVVIVNSHGEVIGEAITN